MKIEQTHHGDTPVDVLMSNEGKAYLKMDDLIITLRAWAEANKEQPAIMGLLREVIILRNKHQKLK